MFYDDKLIKLCKRLSGIICVSYPIKKDVVRVLGYELDVDVKVIHNFVNIRQNQFNYIRESLSINDDIKIITYFSRLSTAKGLLAEKFLFEFYGLAKDRCDICAICAIVIDDRVRKRNIDFYVQSINESLGRTAIYSIGSVYYPEDYFRESCVEVGTTRVILEAISCNVGAIALGSKGYAELVEPNSYEDMIKTYFGEHETSKRINMTFKENLVFGLDNKDKYNVANANKKWILSTFNVDNAMKDLIDTYKSVKNIT